MNWFCFTGNIGCKAVFGRGESTETLPINVVPIPVVSIDPLTLAAILGSTMNITCQAEEVLSVGRGHQVSVDVSHMMWYRNGTLITDSGK